MSENDKQAEPVGVEKFTALMVGENHGLIGPFGSDFKGSPEHYQRITVYTQPAQPVQPAGAQEPVLQRVMGRLADLLDEDQFAEIEGIVVSVGITPPPLAAAINEQLLESLKAVTTAKDLTSYGVALNNARVTIAEAEKAKGGV